MVFNTEKLESPGKVSTEGIYMSVHSWFHRQKMETFSITSIDSNSHFENAE